MTPPESELRELREAWERARNALVVQIGETLRQRQLIEDASFYGSAYIAALEARLRTEAGGEDGGLVWRCFASRLWQSRGPDEIGWDIWRGDDGTFTIIRRDEFRADTLDAAKALAARLDRELGRG